MFVEVSSLMQVRIFSRVVTLHVDYQDLIWQQSILFVVRSTQPISLMQFFDCMFCAIETQMLFKCFAESHHEKRMLCGTSAQTQTMGTRASAKFAMAFIKVFSLVSTQQLFHIQYVNITNRLLRLDLLWRTNMCTSLYNKP